MIQTLFGMLHQHNARVIDLSVLGNACVVDLEIAQGSSAALWVSHRLC